MTGGPVLLDSDTLSELSRGHAKVTARARAYLEEHGRLTISAVTSAITASASAALVPFATRVTPLPVGR